MKHCDKKRLVLLIDEVQCLYASKTRETIRRSKEIVSLAKCTCVFVLMTGSTAALQDLLFHKTPPSKEQCEYANFNNTVFDVLLMNPLRQRDVFVEFVLACQGDALLVDRVFADTGGIAALVRSFCNKEPFQEKSVFTAIELDTDLYPILMFLFSRDRSNNGLPWTQVGATTLELMQVMADQHFARRRLLEFADRGVLFQAPKHEWEMMIPDFFRQMHVALADSEKSFKLDFALFSVLQGFDSDSAARTELEEQILKWCHSLGLLPGSMPMVHVVPNQPVDEYVGRMLKVTCDHGADFLCVRQRGDSLTLSVVQIKLGKGGKIAFGGMAGMWGTGPDFHSIYRRAIVAAHHFRSVLCPDVQVAVDAVYLITSKGVEEKVIERVRREELWGSVEAEIVRTNEKNDGKVTDGTDGIFRSSGDKPELIVIEKDEFFSSILPAEKKIILGFK